MGTRAIAMVSAAGLASAAGAQSAAMMDLRVSVGGGAWVDRVDALPGTRVNCAMFLSWDAGYGLQGAVYQIRGAGGLAGVDRVDITSAGLGRQASFDFGPATQAVYGTAAQFRIDASGDAGNSRERGIATGQENPEHRGTNFNTANPALVYLFDVVVGADGSLRTISLEAPLSELKGHTPADPGVISVYSEQGAQRGTFVSNVSSDGAEIRVVPAPSGAAVLALGSVLAGRRRRDGR